MDYEAARRLYEDTAPGIETTISFNTDDSDVNLNFTSATTTSSSGYRSTVSPSPSPLMKTIDAPEPRDTSNAVSAANDNLQNLHLNESITISGTVQSSSMQFNLSESHPLPVDSSNTSAVHSNRALTRSRARRVRG